MPSWTLSCAVGNKKGYQDENPSRQLNMAMIKTNAFNERNPSTGSAKMFTMLLLCSSSLHMVHLYLSILFLLHQLPFVDRICWTHAKTRSLILSVRVIMEIETNWSKLVNFSCFISGGLIFSNSAIFFFVLCNLAIEVYILNWDNFLLICNEPAISLFLDSLNSWFRKFPLDLISFVL